MNILLLSKIRKNSDNDLIEVTSNVVESFKDNNTKFDIPLENLPFLIEKLE